MSHIFKVQSKISFNKKILQFTLLLNIKLYKIGVTIHV